MESYFLCDFTHTSQGYNAELIPYAIGCIKSYFHANSSRSADIRLYKLANVMTSAFDEISPTIVGFSNFAWNLDLAYTMAEEIKRRAPETLVVFGGPNYPLETHRQKQWLENRPAIDVYVVGEGEEPFLHITEAWADSHDIDSVKRAGIYGTHALIGETLVKNNRTNRDGFDEFPRITDLNATPSPYLMGYLDAFLVDPMLSPLMEGSRGCPYFCTYCVDGIGARNKVHRVDVGRLEAELNYIATRHKGKYLTLADTNFGMYKEDVEFSVAIAKVREKYDYPHHMQVTTGKSQLARIIECSDLLRGAMRFGASVQSLDSQVLENIKRNNISFESLIDLSKRVSDTNTNTYSDVILSLPGDSKTKHTASINRLVDTDINQVRIHTCMVLDGSELATDASRQKFGLRTRFRVVVRSFGRYAVGDHDQLSVETEEVCVENDEMSFADYLECRRFDCTVALFYNERIFLELTRLVHAKGYLVSDWLNFLHSRIPHADPKVQELYADFSAQTEGELNPSREELVKRIKTEPGLLDAYIKGVKGNNVMFNTQARARISILPEMHGFAYGATREFLAARGHSVDVDLDRYLSQLETYSLNKKTPAWLDRLDGEDVVSFDYDFVEQEETHFASLPAETKPTRVRFFFNSWQQEYFSDQLAFHGRSVQGLGKMYSRIAIKKLERSVERVS